MIALRPYQREFLETVIKSWRDGLTRIIGSLATGGGKTICFASLSKQLNTKTIIIAHRGELLDQAAEKMKIVWPEADIGFVRAREDEHDKQIVIASIQTISRDRRLQRLMQYDFKLCIIDESHHAVSDSYQKVVKALGFMDGDKSKLLLGVTATAYRGDGAALGDVFEKIVININIRTLIREGHLSDIRGFRVKTDVDLAGVHSRGGDFIESELALVVNTEARNQLVCDKYMEFAAGRKAISFCVNVQHARDLAAKFEENGIVAAAVWGNMPAEDRKDTLKAYEKGKIQVLTNCGILTEGFDVPDTGCVLMARPTKSRVLYAQCVGRGTRKAPGKKDCVVIDFTENRHDICALPTLLGMDEKKLKDGKTVLDVEREDEAAERERIEAHERIKRVRVEAMDIVGGSRFAWVQHDDIWRLAIKPNVYIELIPVGEQYTVQYQAGRESYPLHDRPLPIGFAMGVAEDHAQRMGDNFARRDASWRSKPASEKQIAFMRSLGLEVTEGLTKGEASELIDKAKQNHAFSK